MEASVTMRPTLPLDVSVYMGTMAARVTSTTHVSQHHVKTALHALTPVKHCTNVCAGKVTMETNARCIILALT